MPDNQKKNTTRLVKLSGSKYTNIYKKTKKAKAEKKEEINVAQFVEKIYNFNVSPKHLRELGLPSDWQKNVSTKYVERVVRTAERFKKDLKELSKR
jgi:hypothetical protein